MSENFAAENYFQSGSCSEGGRQYTAGADAGRARREFQFETADIDIGVIVFVLLDYVSD